jgi:pSer/pThr/pTyr-binding forkhead associated (FHA) protein
VDGAFRLIQKNNPKRCFETRRDSFLVGRAQECDIIIPEAHVSRVQAKVSFENGRHLIKNLGRNALRINGRTTDGGILTPGDEITFGKTRFLYQAGAEPAVVPSSEAKTILAPDTADSSPERRLVCTSPSGQATTHRLSLAKMVIGRSTEADIVLDDPSVSRYHCVIEAREGVCHIRNISASNPLTINAEPANEKRLYSGDQLKIGAWSLAFISSRRDDTRVQEQPHPRHSLRRRWVFVFLVAIAAGYAAYGMRVFPWMNAHTLASIAAQTDAGGAGSARGPLTVVPDQNPPSGNGTAADSPYGTEAHRPTQPLGLANPNNEHPALTVAQLLKEADAYFAEKRYLTPVHQNAYRLYQAVLAREPQNETALKRIEQIREYYRTEGDAHFKAGNWAKALVYLERYTLIDPDATDIREKIATCHRKLAEPVHPPASSPPEDPALTAAAPGEKERVRRLLEESGAQSSWIMKYLFDETPRENDSETPW